VYRPVAAPAGRGIENRSFTERAQVSPPAGDFALASGFVGLIFLVFPASLGLSDRIEDHVTVFRVGAVDSEARPHVRHVEIRTPVYRRCTNLFRVSS
jgi:hypothetical protein